MLGIKEIQSRLTNFLKGYIHGCPDTLREIEQNESEWVDLAKVVLNEKRRQKRMTLLMNQDEETLEAIANGKISIVSLARKVR